MNDYALLEVRKLSVQIDTPRGIVRAVDNVGFSIKKGEVFALVGESGCGKTMTALAINRLLPENAYLCQGSEVILEGVPLQELPEKTMRHIRGRKIGMIFQDPTAALNPVLTVKQQLQETLVRNGEGLRNSQIKKRCIELLQQVRIPDPKICLEEYPHQLSGGMKQRVVIAMALALNPSLLIADEPTTALDVTTQASVLKLLQDLNRQLGMAVLIITHDLGIVAQMAHRVAVMYAGHIVEKGSKEDFIAHPRHPYSQQLFQALPERTRDQQLLAVIPGQVPSLTQTFSLCRFRGRCKFVFSECEKTKPELIPGNGPGHTVRCHWYDEQVLAELPHKLTIDSINVEMEKLAIKEEKTLLETPTPPDKIDLKVENLKVYFPIVSGIFRKTVGYVKAVDGVSLNLYEGKTLALVGESGSGKTTIGKAVLRLLNATGGEINFQGKNVLSLTGRQLRKLRSHFQMIFQDPYSSMDPRMRVGDIIEEGMIHLNIGSDEKERKERVDILLQEVGLPLEFKERFPHELSGGQRQRVAIARALAVGAELIVCDEPTSALDVSVQAQILNLLKLLQKDLGITYLFITHNIGVVNFLADDVAVMHEGKIVEYGPAKTILHNPSHPYTQSLLAAVPWVNKTTHPIPIANDF